MKSPLGRASKRWLRLHRIAAKHVAEWERKWRAGEPTVVFYNSDIYGAHSGFETMHILDSFQDRAWARITKRPDFSDEWQTYKDAYTKRWNPKLYEAQQTRRLNEDLLRRVESIERMMRERRE